jgi:hypothetical protein
MDLLGGRPKRVILVLAALAATALAPAVARAADPPGIGCSANGTPFASGTIVVQAPIACGIAAQPGFLVNWTASSPAGPTAGTSATVTFAGGDGPYSVTATQTDPVDPSNPSPATAFSFTLDTQPPTAPVLARPGNGGHVPAVTPELSWNPSSDAGVGVAGYVVTLDGVQQPETAAAQFVTPLLAQGPHSWSVVAVDGLGRVSASSPTWGFLVDTVPPQVTALAPRDGAAQVAPSSPVTASFSEPVKGGTLRLCPTSCSGGAAVSATTTWTPTGVTLDPKSPLAALTRYEARLTNVTDLAGNPLPDLTWSFTVAGTDAAPGVVTNFALSPGVAQIALRFTPPGDADLARIRVVRRIGGPPTTPTDGTFFDLPPTTSSYTDTRLTPGVRYFYGLWAVDQAGQFAPAPATADAVPTAPPEPAAAGTPTPTKTTAKKKRAALRKTGLQFPQIVHARLLLPPNRAVLTTLRPLLRWRGVPDGTVLVNLQIFERSKAGKIGKVLSRFPARTTRFRVPRGVLSPGLTYVWRVWPWLGKRYTSQPLAVSSFRVATNIELARARARPGRR